MPPSVKIEVAGAEKVERSFWRMGSRAHMMGPIFLLIRKDFQTVMARQFDSEGAYLIPGGWTSLADATIDKKAREGSDMRILHETRALRQSYTTGMGGVYIRGPEEIKIGSAVPYNKYHQQGYHQWRSGTSVPARPPFKMTPALARRWSGGMGAWIVRGHIRLLGRHR